MYHPLYSEMVELLKYVYGQAPGDVLKASIKDNEMVSLYLSAKTVRRIARLLEVVERIAR